MPAEEKKPKPAPSGPSRPASPPPIQPDPTTMGTCKKSADDNKVERREIKIEKGE